MTNQELILELVEIKEKVTALGYKHLQDILPVELGNFEKEMGFICNIEVAIKKSIKQLEKK